MFNLVEMLDISRALLTVTTYNVFVLYHRQTAKVDFTFSNMLPVLVLATFVSLGRTVPCDHRIDYFDLAVVKGLPTPIKYVTFVFGTS